MLNRPSFNIRRYIFFIFAIFLCGLIFIVDNFTNKRVSNFIPNNVSIVSNFKISEKFLENDFLMLFESKSDLINENLRLKNEVLELRRLKELNFQLSEEIESYSQFIKKAQLEDTNYTSTRLILKNSNEELLINGGRDLNFMPGDLVLNNQYVIVGYLEEVFNDYSILETLNSPDFSIQMIDKYNNIYTVTNSGNQIFLNSNADVNNYDVDDILFSDTTLGSNGSYPFLKLSDFELTYSNNKLSGFSNNIFEINMRTLLYVEND